MYWQKPKCPVCGDEMQFMAKMCGDCAAAKAMREAREEAAIALWAANGMRQLRKYLEGWAAFREYERNH